MTRNLNGTFVKATFDTHNPFSYPIFINVKAFYYTTFTNSFFVFPDAGLFICLKQPG